MHFKVLVLSVLLLSLSLVSAQKPVSSTEKKDDVKEGPYPVYLYSPDSVKSDAEKKDYSSKYPYQKEGYPVHHDYKGGYMREKKFRPYGKKDYSKRYPKYHSKYPHHHHKRDYMREKEYHPYGKKDYSMRYHTYPYGKKDYYKEDYGPPHYHEPLLILQRHIDEFLFKSGIHCNDYDDYEEPEYEDYMDMEGEEEEEDGEEEEEEEDSRMGMRMRMD